MMDWSCLVHIQYSFRLSMFDVWELDGITLPCEAWPAGRRVSQESKTQDCRINHSYGHEMILMGLLSPFLAPSKPVMVSDSVDQ